jgi:hypothetical protein
VEEAIARFMPEYAAERRQQAADGRYFTIDHAQVSFAGISRIHGELDLADALDLPTGATVVEEGTQRVPRPRTREIVLYVHLSEDAVRCGDPNTPVRVEDAGGQLLTAGQVAEWCRRDDTARITVKPVIDLHQQLAVDQYKVPAQIAERIQLRDKTCVHPYCNRPARSCDTDHIDPYDEDGPPGQTATDNLAALCRLHHRMKTHGGWTYTMLEPGVFLWASPHGHSYLRDQTGTTDLTPGTRRPTPSTNQLTPTPPHQTGAGPLVCPSTQGAKDLMASTARSRKASSPKVFTLKNMAALPPEVIAVTAMSVPTARTLKQRLTRLPPSAL